MLPQWKWYLSLKFLFNSSYLFWTPQLHYKISKFKFMIFIIIYLGVLNYNKCQSKPYPQCNSYQPQFTNNFSILQWKYNVATEKHYCFFVGYILYNFKMQEKYMKLIFRWFGCNKIYTPQSLINNFWSKLSPSNFPFPLFLYFIITITLVSATILLLITIMVSIITTSKRVVIPNSTGPFRELFFWIPRVSLTPNLFLH